MAGNEEVKGVGQRATGARTQWSPMSSVNENLCPIELKAKGEAGI